MPVHRLLPRVASLLSLTFFGASLLFAQGVTIVKSTNGQHPSAPPGPIVPVGSTVTWTYLVSNISGRDLTNVSVSDDPAGAITCPSTTLTAGTSMTCTATGTAVAGQYTNTGTVMADDGGVPVSASDVSYYYGQPPGLLSLVKSTNGQDANTPPGPVVAPGSTVNWTYVVTNTSSDPLTGVSVTDDQGVTVSCPQTTLSPGESMTCTASGTAITGQYTNIGIASATHPVVGPIVATDPSNYFGQGTDFDFGDAPDSYGTSFASNGARHSLDPAVFLGACVDAELDALVSPAADGDDTNAGTTTNGTCATPGDDEDGVVFNGSLVAGQSASVTVVANAPCTLSAWIDFGIDGGFGVADSLFPGGTALAAGSNTLNFTVPPTATAGQSYARFRCTTDGPVGPTGAARDGEVEDYQVTLVPSADLSVSKSDSPDPVTPGSSLTYTITVTNAGPSSAPVATLSDSLPAGTTFMALAAPGGWSCSTPAVGANGMVSCNAASMTPGSATFTLTVATAASLAPASTISNTSTASSSAVDLVPGNNSATATTTVGPAQSDVSVAKTGSPNPVAPGGNLTYTITVGNAGPSDAAGLTLTDILPAGTTFVSLTAPGGWTCSTPAAGANGTVSCTAPILPPGVNFVFTLVVKVDPATAAGTSISNTATVSSTSSDPAAGNNSSTMMATASAAQADLSIAKTGAGVASAGTPITYTINVTNNGPSTATSVVMSDTLPAQTTFLALVSPGGWACTTPAAGTTGSVSCSAPSMAPGNAVFTLTVFVGSSVPNGTSISNTAQVASPTADSNLTNNSSTLTTTSAQAVPALSGRELIALLLVLAGLGAVMIRRT